MLMFPKTVVTGTMWKGLRKVKRLQILAAATGMALVFGSATTAQAFIQEHYDKILKAIENGEPVECDGCNLSYANLSDMDLTGATLNGAYLYGARLRGTILRDAQLDRADFTRVDLEGADLTGASMSEIRAVSAKWCGTTMPDGTVNDSRC